MSFTEAELRELADAAMFYERARIEAGVNVEDKQAKPLDAPYARWKQRHGLKAIRDLKNSGKLLASRDVVATASGRIEMGFRSEQEEQVAARNQAIEPMFGLSPQNIEDVTGEAHRIFATKFR